jgi:hypothetical protein
MEGSKNGAGQVEGEELECIEAVRWDGGDEDGPNVPGVWG